MQEETLRMSCFAVDGSLNSHIRAVQHFIAALWSLKEIEVCARHSKKGRHHFEELALEVSISQVIHAHCTKMHFALYDISC